MAIAVVTRRASPPGHKEAINITARIQAVLEAVDAQVGYSGRFICSPGEDRLVVRGVNRSVAAACTVPPRCPTVSSLDRRRDGRRVHVAAAIAQIGLKGELARRAGSRLIQPAQARQIHVPFDAKATTHISSHGQVIPGQDGTGLQWGSAFGPGFGLTKLHTLRQSDLYVKE